MAPPPITATGKSACGRFVFCKQLLELNRQGSNAGKKSVVVSIRCCLDLHKEQILNVPLSHYIGLLRNYLKPQIRRVLLLAVLLFSGIGLQLLNPQVIRRFIDAVQNGATQGALITLALIFLGVVLLQRGMTIATTYVSRQIAWAATNGLRRDLARHVLKLDMGFHNAHSPGELLERIDGDVDRLANFFSEFLLQILSGILLTIGVLLLLWPEDWRIALVLAGFVVAYVVVHTRGQQMAAPYWAQERQFSAELMGFVEERLAGVRDIQTSGAVPYTMRRFYELVRRRTWQALKADVVTDIGWTISKIFYDLGTVVGMALGAYLFLQGQITLGTVYLIITYLGMLNGPLNQIAHQLEDLQQARVAIERVRQLFQQVSQVVDAGKVILPAGQALPVAFEQVSFAYHNDVSVLDDLSFILQPGQKLGLLGRTGSGKTTLSRLLFRLYDVSSGCITLGGHDLRQVQLTNLRQRIGLVTQEVQLFPASVRDNLTLFDTTIADEQIWASLRQLGLERWVQQLPNSLDTQLAADGNGLSAGEGQLLALARLFLKDPGLIILDEASSRLDPATERLLEQALDKLLAGRTAIIIAHRLATVRRADLILILAQGKVQEFGPYQQLANNPASRLANLLRTASQHPETQSLDEVITNESSTLQPQSKIENQRAKILAEVPA
jgi:ABC-type multidrug transport system fused ATPase/permease subunit